MDPLIHPTSVVEDGAEIGDACRIGPMCHVGGNVRMGRGNVLLSNVVIGGHTTLGDDNQVFPFACLGMVSQDLKFDPSWTSSTVIGSGNVFREYATVNASSTDGGSTVIGDRCLFLSYSHVAHDCVVGDHVIVSSDSKMAGHVRIADHAVISAKTGVVQFVRVGRHAFVGGFNKVTKDILPYCIADGFPSVLRAVNRIGLERSGFPAETIRCLREAFRIVIRSPLTVSEAVAELRARFPEVREVLEMADFAAASTVGLARPRRGTESE